MTKFRSECGCVVAARALRRALCFSLRKPLNDAVMLDQIFALKFIHVLAAAAMFGTWLCLAMIMLRGHRSANPSVIAVTAQFVVDLEKMVMAPAVAIQPASGFPLAWAIGLSPLDEFWIVASLILLVLAFACWLGGFRIETRIRSLSRRSALAGVALPADYRWLFRVWSSVAAVGLLAMTAIFALMVWQPRFD
jgi:uncharacterized membrane protein